MKKNEWALITGASQGLGEHFARLAAADGYNLLLVARSIDKLNALAESLGQQYAVSVEVLPLDLSQPAIGDEVSAFILKKDLTISVLVNNAGFGDYGFFHEMDWSRQQQMLRLNIETLTHLTYIVLPGMVARRRGYVLNVASTAAFQPGPLMAVYYATKAYVLSLSEALSNELGGTGVSCTCLAPGATRTGFAAASNMADSPLFNKPGVMNADDVAKAGWAGMLAGKRVVIPGLVNRLMAWSAQISPRGITAKIARNMQEKKK